MENLLVSSSGISLEHPDFYHYYDASVYRFSATSGKLLWQTPLPRNSTQPNDGHLLVAEGAVYVIRDFDLIALERRNGELLWHVSTGSEQRCFQSGLEDGRIYLYSLDQTFRAFDGRDGSLLWHNSTFTTPSGYHFSVCHGQLYVPWNQGMVSDLYALDGTTGALRWSVSLPQASLPSKPVVEKGVVYLVANEYAFALDEQRGTQLWQQEIPKTILHSPLLADGILSAQSPAVVSLMWTRTPWKDTLPHLVTLDARTGKLLWMLGPGYRRLEGIPIVDGLLVAAYGEWEPVDAPEGPNVSSRFQATGREGIVGLDAHTGKRAVSYPLQNAIWGSFRQKTLSLLEAVAWPQEAVHMPAKYDFFLKTFHPTTGQQLSAHLLSSGESAFLVKEVGNEFLYQRITHVSQQSTRPTTDPFLPPYFTVVAYRLSDGSRAWTYTVPPHAREQHPPSQSVKEPRATPSQERDVTPPVSPPKEEVMELIVVKTTYTFPDGTSTGGYHIKKIPLSTPPEQYRQELLSRPQLDYPEAQRSIEILGIDETPSDGSLPEGMTFRQAHNFEAY